MGIQDLMAWIKKTRPETITHIKNRFLDPRLRGKKVAIDATLITNTFHFRKVQDEDGKQALIGWYTLIREMRAAQVEPIAIWDKKGTREWKAAEARKRLAARALHLARRNHEDERASRLQGLKEALMEVQSMPEEEQQKLRDYWAKERWTKYGPPEGAEVRPVPPPSAKINTDESIPEMEAVPAPQAAVERISTKVDKSETPPTPIVADVPPPAQIAPTPTPPPEILSKVSTLLSSYRLHDRPRAGRDMDIEPDTTEGLAHIRDFEVFTDEPLEGGQVETVAEVKSKDGKRQDLEMDEKIRELVPFDEYTETPTQQGLTIAEGRIIDALLGVVSPADLEVARVDLEPSLERLDRIIDAAPEIRERYAKALKLPSKDDHDNCKELLLKMGVPVLLAPVPYEAEGMAASMARQGLVDFVGTEDSDVLGYEGPLLRHIGTGGRPLMYISGQTVREHVGFTPEQYLDFMILLGNDAASRIHGVGPVTSFKLISKHASIEAILENEPKIAAKIPENYMAMVTAARSVFSDLPDIPADAVLEQGVWDDYKVNRWLEKEHGLSFMEDDEYEEEEEDGDRFEVVADGAIEGEPNWDELVRAAMEELPYVEDHLRDSSVVEVEKAEVAVIEEAADLVEDEDWTAIAEEEMSRTRD